MKGVVCSNRPDSKNMLYQTTIKQVQSLLSASARALRVCDSRD